MAAYISPRQSLHLGRWSIGPLLLALGILIGHTMSTTNVTPPERATGQTGQDWHGNVMRSHWSADRP